MVISVLSLVSMNPTWAFVIPNSGTSVIDSIERMFFFGDSEKGKNCQAWWANILKSRIYLCSLFQVIRTETLQSNELTSL